VTGYLVAGPTHKEMEKEEAGFLIKTDSARHRQEQQQEEVEIRRLDARILGDKHKILDEAISQGVAGKQKPALPKAALGVAPLHFLSAALEFQFLNSDLVGGLSRLDPQEGEDVPGPAERAQHLVRSHEVTRPNAIPARPSHFTSTLAV